MDELNYNECKKKTINSYLKKYEKKKLLNVNKKPIENYKQALAISLSIAEKKCKNKLNKDDYKNMKIKIINICENKNKKINLSNLKNANLLIQYFKDNKKYNQINFFKNLLTLKFLNDMKNNISKPNISLINELIKIINI